MFSRLIFTAFVALVGGCASLRQTPDPALSVTEEVTAFLSDYLDAVDSRDAGRILAAYVADDRFVWIEEGKVRYRRADEVLAALAMYPAGSAIRTEFNDLTVVPVSQSGAHAWATFRTSVGSGSSGFTFGGAISFVLERHGNAWKIVGGHTSSPGEW